jgi:hypothetical protein
MVQVGAGYTAGVDDVVSKFVGLHQVQFHSTPLVTVSVIGRTFLSHFWSRGASFAFFVSSHFSFIS